MFTKRENEIIHLIGKGWKSQIIAEKLYVSSETIKTHRKNILLKIRQTDTEISLLEFCIEYAAKLKNPP